MQTGYLASICLGTSDTISFRVSEMQKANVSRCAKSVFDSNSFAVCTKHLDISAICSVACYNLLREGTKNMGTCAGQKELFHLEK